MLPRATHTRTAREAARGKQSGRTQEIQRLIGRSLRAITDLNALGERTSRSIATCCRPTAARAPRRSPVATSHWRAACEHLVKRRGSPRARCTARWRRCRSASCGGVPVLDLDYAEDSQAETDMNVVMNNGGAFIEMQGTAEGHAFRRHELDALLNLAAAGIGSCSRCRHRHSSGRDAPCVLASANPGKLRELAAHPRAARPRARLAARARHRRPAERPAAPSSRTRFSRHATPRRSRARRRSPMTPVIEVDALGGRPGCGRRASAARRERCGQPRAPARGARTDVPARARQARYQCVIAWVRCADDPPRSSPAAPGKGASRSSPAAAAASATTRSSSRPATRAPPRSSAGGEESRSVTARRHCGARRSARHAGVYSRP